MICEQEKSLTLKNLSKRMRNSLKTWIHNLPCLINNTLPAQWDNRKERHCWSICSTDRNLGHDFKISWMRQDAFPTGKYVTDNKYILKQNYRSRSSLLSFMIQKQNNL